MAIVGSKNVASQIAEALGLSGRAVRRIVIDVRVDGLLKYYVEEVALAPPFDAGALCAALRESAPQEVASEPVMAPGSLGKSAPRGKS